MINDVKKVLSCEHTTAELILNMYYEAKTLDKDTMLDIRDSLVGVGKKGELLRFYFTNKKGDVLVKFKHKPRSEKLLSLSWQEIVNNIKSVYAVFNAGNFQLVRGRDAASFKVDMSKYDFVQGISEGLNPFTGEKIFDCPQDVSLALKNIALFILRYDKIDSSSFRVLTKDDKIQENAEKIISQKRSRQVVKERVGSFWTEAEDEKLKEEYSNNMLLDDIAAAHGRTRSAIERRILKIMPMEDIKK